MGFCCAGVTNFASPSGLAEVLVSEPSSSSDYLKRLLRFCSRTLRSKSDTDVGTAVMSCFGSLNLLPSFSDIIYSMCSVFTSSLLSCIVIFFFVLASLLPLIFCSLRRSL